MGLKRNYCMDKLLQWKQICDFKSNEGHEQVVMLHNKTGGIDISYVRSYFLIIFDVIWVKVKVWFKYTIEEQKPWL